MLIEIFYIYPSLYSSSISASLSRSKVAKIGKINEEDLTDKILGELGDEYKELVCAVQTHDTPTFYLDTPNKFQIVLDFDELHEILLTFKVEEMVKN